MSNLYSAIYRSASKSGTLYHWIEIESAGSEKRLVLRGHGAAPRTPKTHVFASSVQCGNYFTKWASDKSNLANVDIRSRGNDLQMKKEELLAALPEYITWIGAVIKAPNFGFESLWASAFGESLYGSAPEAPSANIQLTSRPAPLPECYGVW